MTYRDIEVSFGISQIAIHSILHEHLALEKSRIPHILIEAHKKVPRVNWRKETMT